MMTLTDLLADVRTAGTTILLTMMGCLGGPIGCTSLTSEQLQSQQESMKATAEFVRDLGLEAEVTGDYGPAQFSLLEGIQLDLGADMQFHVSASPGSVTEKDLLAAFERLAASCKGTSQESN